MEQMYTNIAGSNIFSTYITKESIFKNKDVLSASFIPNKIFHREDEISKITAALAPVIKGYQPNNIFIYGTVGTGKTISTKYVLSQLEEIAKKTEMKVKTIYINCKMKKVADTEYRLLAQLLKDFNENVPDTGLPTDVLYRKFFDMVEQTGKNIILVLDEIDVLVKKVGDELLYNLTRINTELKNSSITIVGITNDLSFRDGLDIRIKSSLSDEEIIFKPYDALQLRDILAERASAGFNRGAVNDNVINKCAALAAQEHGDARRALDLLRVAGELAERSNNSEVGEYCVDKAEEKIDMDRITESVKIQPKHSQLVLYSIIKLDERRSKEKWTDNRMLTGDVFTLYSELCVLYGTKSLTQRRISDLIGELDMLGIITAKVISNGRYGRTREISVAVASGALNKIKEFMNSCFGE